MHLSISYTIYYIAAIKLRLHTFGNARRFKHLPYQEGMQYVSEKSIRLCKTAYMTMNELQDITYKKTFINRKSFKYFSFDGIHNIRL